MYHIKSKVCPQDYTCNLIRKEVTPVQEENIEMGSITPYSSTTPFEPIRINVVPAQIDEYINADQTSSEITLTPIQLFNIEPNPAERINRTLSASEELTIVRVE